MNRTIHILRHHILLLLVALLATSCHHSNQTINLDQRAHVDRLNKEAFLNRFDSPQTTISASHEALRYISDSLPSYHNGRLRAWNNIAKAYYNISIPDSATTYADSVINYTTTSSNTDIEILIAKLTHAKVKQRNCDIAGSYRLLYDIAQSDILEHNRHNLLYNYAKSEYYVTLLSLNYYYRKGMQTDIKSLLEEVESSTSDLQCDYAQDLFLNYALANGYTSLCIQAEQQESHLSKALSYIQANLNLLSDSTHFSLLHFANIVQLTASIVSNPQITKTSWQLCASQLDSICTNLQLLGLDVHPDSTLATTLYIESSYMLEAYGDPYHTLGAMVFTGNLCMRDNDTSAAQSWYLEAYRRQTQNPVIAPKYEIQLYDGLLQSKAALCAEEAENWAAKSISLHNLIKQNEADDFLLQTQLRNAQHSINNYRIFSIVILILALLLIILAILLTLRSRALRLEKRQLQEARQRDIERIANVETCLSVMRHDINPFISYLQNKELPDDLKQEVFSQLLRTFDNLKNWTNLSIPSGLAFNASNSRLDNIFHEAASMVIVPKNTTLQIPECQLNVIADKLLLIILIRNILNNAVQHSQASLITLSANSFPDDTRFAEISVSDNGIGMSQEMIDNLFHADRKQKSDGSHSGFGLILCRYIMKKHDDNTIRGCRIWVESTQSPLPNHGTSFHILVQKAN